MSDADLAQVLAKLAEIEDRLMRMETGIDLLVFREIAVQYPVEDEQDPPPQETTWRYA